MDVAYYWSFAAVVGYGVNSGRCEDLDNGRLSEYDSFFKDKTEKKINCGARSMVRPVGALRVRQLQLPRDSAQHEAALGRRQVGARARPGLRSLARL